MNDLDDPGIYQKADPQDFLASIEGLGGQIREACLLGKALDPLPDAAGVDSIAILGVGGSGIAGDVIKAALCPPSRLFVEAVKGYELPGWVGSNTLVFALSYSGNTEETLACSAEAKKAGARMVVLAGGGRMAEGLVGDPVVRLPRGLQPRAALGYLAIPMMVICSRLGLCDADPDVEEALELVERRTAEYGREASVETNRAKQLAGRLTGRIPLIYGSEGITAVAAYRWKCQFNECSKTPAFHNFFPELGHNEIAGWQTRQKLTRSAFALVVLRHEAENTRTSKRIEATLPLLEPHFGALEQVSASGDSSLARLFDLICLGDFTATYLAIAEGTDPTPIEVIEKVKKDIAS